MIHELLKSFESQITISDQLLTLRSSPVENVDLGMFFPLIDKNLGKFYRQVHGANWVQEKEEEMKEPGLMYLWYENLQKETETKPQIQSPVAFMSFMVTVDEGKDVIYLYEIHVDPAYHGSRIGTTLVRSLHRAACELARVGRCSGVSLTVFLANTKALEWYRRLGYELTEGSPRDRRLRSGRVVKPEYYIMNWDVQKNNV